MITKKVVCPITGYWIEYSINQELKEAYLDNIQSDFIKQKPLALLIRTSIEELKKDGILTLKQYIHVDEYTNYLQGATSWEIESCNFDIYKMKCPIDDATKNIAVGLGWN